MNFHPYISRVATLLTVFTFIGLSIFASDEKAKPREIPATAKQKIDFVKHIKPILDSRCVACHGEESQEGRLRLDAKKLVFKGGISGKLFEIGNSEKSLLVARLVGHGDGDAMPLDDDPLSNQEIGQIRAWIDQGAQWPDGVGSQADSIEIHWAYEKPVRPAVPNIAGSNWISNPIDAFVLGKLTEKKLQPSPMASKSQQLRRVYLDLIGLPPTVEELDAFLADNRDDAYARVVNKLLDSDRFGEHWARPWLDMARYADSNGYQADQYREVWAYRDWVISALNKNMPYDQFTVEQLAGDLLPNATTEQKIATGFHRMTTCNVEAGVDPEENRVNQIIDRVNTTGTVWLGTTMECAQCHNHKYDPFNMEDYYGLFAFFNNTPMEVKHTSNTTYDFFGPKMPIPLTTQQRQKQSQLRAQEQELTTQLAELQKQHLTGFARWEKEQRSVLAPDKPSSQNESDSWQVATVLAFESKNGATHQVLDDNSVLIGGPKPDTDTYIVEIESDLPLVRGIQLETLTHDSLPGKGPGRHHPEKPNFVLQDFTIEHSSSEENKTEADAKPNRIALKDPQADYSQSRYHIKGAIDNDKSTGWAIHAEFHRDHYATFATANPVTLTKGSKLKITMIQNHGQGRTIGRLRISLSSKKPQRIQTSNEPAQSDDGKKRELLTLLKIEPGKRNASQKKKLQQHYLNQFDDVNGLKGQLSNIQQSLLKIQQPTTLVMIEMDKSRETKLFKRGEFLNPGRNVEARTPRILHELQSDDSQDRLALAQWIVSKDNPLAARVAVNRWWAEIFGQGIVRTLEDFGTQGNLPTHPQLLDWLAVEFMESGWDMKHVLKLIVTSSTYRQSSRVTPLHLKIDPENRWLARMPRVRMSAEMIRDNALTISGLLSTKMTGAPIFPPQPGGVWRHVGRNSPKYIASQNEDRFRRGIYVIWRRSAPYASFVNFDAPDRAACVVKRPRTNTPLQALTLLNDEAYIEMAWALARRIMTNSKPDLSERIDYAFRSCLARYPSSTERDFLIKMFAEQKATFEEDLKATKQILKGQHVPAKTSETEFATWFIISNTLLNLDETITKN